ncbi:MAG: hypothetical protein HOP19_22110 [Acidobacteria bacterium]|nr:hypothetical protein [Acidobacteriota bacterium]
MPVVAQKPENLVVGPDRNLWVIGPDGLARVTPTGAVTGIPLASSYAGRNFIVSGSDGNLWFTRTLTVSQPTSGSSFLVKADVRGQVLAQYSLGYYTPKGLVAEPGSTLRVAFDWFLKIEHCGAVPYTIWQRYKTDGERVGGEAGGILGLHGYALDTQGRLWVGGISEYFSGACVLVNNPRTLLGVVNQLGVNEEIAFTTRLPLSLVPARFAFASDGRIWFVGSDLRNLGYFVPSRQGFFFADLPATHSFNDLVWGPDNNLWWVDTARNSISRFTTAGSFLALGTSANAASYRDFDANPGQISALFGTDLATETRAAATNPLPTSLAGVTVAIMDNAGIEHTAPLFFVSPGQINYQLPPAVAAGFAIVKVKRGEQAIQVAAINVNEEAASGLFTFDGNGQGVPAGLILRVRANGTISYEPLAQLNPTTKRYEQLPIVFGAPTEQLYLVLFGTGIARRGQAVPYDFYLDNIAHNHARDTRTLADYAGPQRQLVGLDQVNVLLPRSLAGAGDMWCYLVNKTNIGLKSSGVLLKF